jgi:hypothetical protein
MFEHPEIQSVDFMLRLKNLKRPNYQRPYKWGVKNVLALLGDIEFAIQQENRHSSFKYRVGTIILHDDEEEGVFNIVDGLQRIITLALIYKALADVRTPILDIEIKSKISEENIIRNFQTIKEHCAYLKPEMKSLYLDAMTDVLEFVVVSTKHLAEAFQLFDSQNTRGKELAPHDLLKAYHLRAMRNHPNEMKHTVERWEQTNPKDIYVLFQDYLFPIKCWSDRNKGHKFTTADIDEYKGVAFDMQYFYAMRAVKGMPVYQIDQPFVSGKNFFEFIEHYLNLLSDVKTAVENPDLGLFLDEDEKAGVGFSYAKQLFLCSVLYYCDRFRNFDERIIRRLYTWAFMIRLRMQKLGFDTVKNYAIGTGDDESVALYPMFYHLRKSMNEPDVLKIRTPMLPVEDMKYRDSDNRAAVIKSMQRITVEQED